MDAALKVSVISNIAVLFQQNNNSLLLNSDSDSDDEEEIMLFKLNPKKKVPVRIKYFFETTITSFNDKEFRKHFRINKLSFELLYNLVGQSLQNNNTTGRPSKDIEKKLLAVLWLLAIPDSYRSVGMKFGLGTSSLSDAFFKIVVALAGFANQFIKWPREESALIIMEKFQNIAGMPNVLGAVDGTFVPIKAPQNHAEVYITRKCNYAFTLQAISDPNLKFIDCFIGYPGSVSDCRIFRNSPIYRAVQNNYEDYFPQNQYILGDKAYPLLQWCIPPYIARQRLNDIQINFNRIHAKTRQVVERSFALSFGRFRRLKYLDMQKIEHIPATVIACCVLHNLCLSNEDRDVEELIREGGPFVAEQNADMQIDGILGEENENNTRDNIALQLYNI